MFNTESQQSSYFWFGLCGLKNNNAGETYKELSAMSNKVYELMFQLFFFILNAVELALRKYFKHMHILNIK